MNCELSFPDIGKRSPILKGYIKNLSRAYYITNALIFLGIALVFGHVKWQQWRYAEMLKNSPPSKPPIVYVDISKFGPPPSIHGDEPLSTLSAVNPGVSAVGVPLPVPDLLAIQPTSPTQADIAGNNVLQSNLADSGAIIQIIPSIGVYVPHDVKPAVINKPPLDYPTMARQLDQEGTVYIKALIDLDGSVMNVVIMRSSGYPILDAAAVGNVSEWKFTPAFQNKKPVRVWVGSNVKFSLK